MIAPNARATLVTSRLWALIAARRFLESHEPQLVPDWFSSQDIDSWPLPHRGGTQVPTVVSGDEFHRFTEHDQELAHYKEHRGTRVFESIEMSKFEWYSAACLQLAGLAGCRVVASLYQSTAQDEGLGRHVDAWHGLVIQIEGTKRWQLGEAGTGWLQMQPGDVLLLPEGVPHLVSTPDSSVHLVFAFIQQEPIGAANRD